jgi:hypothetical protein
MDSSSLRVFRKLVITTLSSRQYSFVPQTPISQSSAYRTYSMRVNAGLGIELLSLLRCLIILALTFQCSGLLVLWFTVLSELIFCIRADSET